MEKSEFERLAFAEAQRCREEDCEIVAGYKRVAGRIYEPEAFYRRARETVARRVPPALAHFPFGRRELGTLVRALWHLGVRDEARRYFWKLVGLAALRGPVAVGFAVTLLLMGHHLRTLSRDIVEQPDGAPAVPGLAVAAE